MTDRLIDVYEQPNGNVKFGEQMHIDTELALKALAVNANLVANIGNSATGTQIATAVNGILAILISAGLMKAS